MLTTLWPVDRIMWRTTAEPMNPQPPVRSTRILQPQIVLITGRNLPVRDDNGNQWFGDGTLFPRQFIAFSF
jgi:hypothetical protein